MSDTNEELLKPIAKKHLGVEHWETRGRDQLDFHDVSIGSIRKALDAAYKAGSKETLTQLGIAFVLPGDQVIMESNALSTLQEQLDALYEDCQSLGNMDLYEYTKEVIQNICSFLGMDTDRLNYPETK